MSIQLKSIKFHNFKALRNFTLSLKDMNILVGLNNSGKSTILSALRALHVALRKPRSKKAVLVDVMGHHMVYGHIIDASDFPLSLENVPTNCEEVDASVTFTFSNRNKLILAFPQGTGHT